MKNWKKQIGTAVAVGMAGMVLAQGSLTPPGAPGTTMKTLSQLDTSITGVSNRVEVVRSAVATVDSAVKNVSNLVANVHVAVATTEPRTPISTATTITQPGSYYLTENITVASGNGITISTDNVSLDLNGFTIESTAASATGFGIYINGTRRNIAIANGFIKGGATWNGTSFTLAGFNYGIYSSLDSNITVSEVVVERGSVSGIYLADNDSTVVVSCTVRTCGGYGIVAGRVESSIALECGNTAILGDQVTNCRGWSVLTGTGIQAETVRGCYGRTDKGMYGISATTVHDSYGYASSASSAVYGISATTVNNSYGYGTSSGGNARGINGSSINNCFGYGTCNGSYTGYGIDADTVQNSYGYCSGDSNGTGYGIQAESTVNCRGDCPIGWGIGSDTAGNCSGSGKGGIVATVINGCRGVGTTSYGISGTTVNNSCGFSTSGAGLLADCAQNSYGYTASGFYGIYVYYMAIGCGGISSGTGTGIEGRILNSCYGNSTSGTAVSAPYKYNMP